MSFPQHSQPPRFGGCDSFFVQSEDDTFTAAEHHRERARAIARVHHRQLGQELSKLTAMDYQEDILDHMEFMESETMPDVGSIDIQTEIQWFMRPYLLDFLIEAHQAFQLLPDTFFLAVNLLDRYCSRRVVYKRHYQLVGCAALLIASKYGDRKEKVPTVRELRGMCCQLYDEDMFLQMEWHVLQTLGWVIGHPTVDSFLQIALQESASEDDMELQHMTWYLCEMGLFHKEFLSVRPSVLARSALALARCILGRPQPARDNYWVDQYDSTIVFNLHKHLQSCSQVLSRKYCSISFSSVAHTVEYFLQAQEQRQAAPEPAPPVVIEPKVESNVFGTPQTPQKHPYGAAVMQHGCITPPITPENEQFGHPGYAKPYFTPAAYPPTPTPIHSSSMSDRYQSERYAYDHFIQPHHVQ